MNRNALTAMALFAVMLLPGCGQIKDFKAKLVAIENEIAALRMKIGQASIDWQQEAERLLDGLDKEVKDILSDSVVRKFIDARFDSFGDNMKTMVTMALGRAQNYLHAFEVSIRARRIAAESKGGITKEMFEVFLKEAREEAERLTRPFVGNVNPDGALKYTIKRGKIVLKDDQIQLDGFGFLGKQFTVTGLNSDLKAVWKANKASIVAENEFDLAFYPAKAGSIPQEVERLKICHEGQMLCQMSLMRIKSPPKPVTLRSVGLQFRGAQKFPRLAFKARLVLVGETTRPVLAKWSGIGAGKPWRKGQVRNSGWQVVKGAHVIKPSSKFRLEISATKGKKISDAVAQKWAGEVRLRLAYSNKKRVDFSYLGGVNFANGMSDKGSPTISLYWAGTGDPVGF